MPRPRQYTEHVGLAISLQERRIFEAYLKARKLKATEYLRQVAILPLMQAQGEQDGQE